MSHNFQKFHYLLLVCLMTAITGVAEAGSVQFSTYYPAPFGMYDRLRLVPRTALTPPCDPGTMYINANAGNRLEVCGAAGDVWAPLSGGPWTQVGSNIYATDTTANVGIGTTTPDEELHVNQTVGNVALRLGDLGTNDWDLIRSVGNDSIPSGSFALKMLGAAVPSIVADTTGNVGIGTTAPNNTLQVTGLVNFDDAKSSTSVGKSAGAVNTGDYNSFFGYQAGFSNTTANQNTAIGYQALYSTTTGNYNTATGRDALRNNTGSGNTANGASALRANTTGTDNTAVGVDALYSNTTGDSNTASGVFALRFNTAGYKNTASGYNALGSNTTGYYNTASGYNTLSANTNGLGNTATGYYALAASNTGSDNTATGVQALGSNTSGGYNTASGYNALSANTIGNNNIGIGYSAGINITSGSRNIVIGSEIYAPSATGNNQMSIGNLIFGTGLDGTLATISTGNIGIGTNAPAARLEVSGGAIKATGGFILETRTTNPGTPVDGQMWLCTDTGDATPCNGI